MRRWHQDKRARARIEVIPMIDVMMFLLVFFVLISIDVIPAFGVKTRLPSAASAEANRGRHNAVVSLGRSGELQLDGLAVTGEELLPRLVAIRQAHPDVSVIINGDRSVELQRVIEVMERIRAAGFLAISIAAKKTP